MPVSRNPEGPAPIRARMLHMTIVLAHQIAAAVYHSNLHHLANIITSHDYYAIVPLMTTLFLCAFGSLAVATWQERNPIWMAFGLVCGPLGLAFQLTIGHENQKRLSRAARRAMRRLLRQQLTA